MNLMTNKTRPELTNPDALMPGLVIAAPGITAPLPDPDHEPELSPSELAEVTATIKRDSAAPTTLKPVKEMRELMLKPVPPRFVKTMPGRGGSKPLSYLPWVTVHQLLSHYAPGFRMSISHIQPAADGCMVAVELEVPCSDGVIKAAGSGYKAYKSASGKETGFGGASVVAERQAFKRAAAMLGIGFSLYLGD